MCIIRLILMGFVGNLIHFSYNTLVQQQPQAMNIKSKLKENRENCAKYHNFFQTSTKTIRKDPTHEKWRQLGWQYL
jgi:hypothetical protein